MVADALGLTQVRDEIVAMTRDPLEDALDRGDEDITAGRVIQLETEDESAPHALDGLRDGDTLPPPRAGRSPENAPSRRSVLSWMR
jgi:hypothetical protein